MSTALNIKISPFNPKLVTVLEPADPTTLLYIDGKPQRIVGRASLGEGHNAYDPETQNNRYTPPVPVLIVEAK